MRCQQQASALGLRAALLASTLYLLVGGAGVGSAGVGSAQELRGETPAGSEGELLVKVKEEVPKRKSDPIPPLAIPLSDAASLARIPDDVMERKGLQLVLDRKHHQLLVLKDGLMTRRFPAAVGTTGWETPAGRFRVFEKVKEPLWTHPVSGELVDAESEKNPLGSRWIGFHRDCKGRTGWDGEQYLDINGCTVAGFHGTPFRWTVGRAVSHGCVRLYEENVQEVFDLVRVGTQVTVLP
ncbi:L,D-transpeptidase [Synechococcus sp. WH 8016]|uniref:L,D-transpeptidase n=1 Tax=Synechococcus sp. WH 8016 TaxID=166318 RepID=UPI000571F355|nr:L,D-transpeptidase [Synechococcus sp. WH 8016]